MDGRRLEDEIFASLQRMRTLDDLFGIDSGRGIIGDMIADRQLARDIADGSDVRDALASQRLMDNLFGNGHSHGIISDMIEDNIIAADYENGNDIGEAIAKQRFWDNLFE